MTIAATLGCSTSCAHEAPSSKPPDHSGTRMVRIAGGLHRHLGAKHVIKPFLLDVTEVTTGSYLLCVRDGACTPAPARDFSQSELCNLAHSASRSSHPINCVTYAQAAAFCRWRGARLPTANEWRWTAENRWRRTKFPWGNRPFSRHPCKPSKEDAPCVTCPAGSGHATRDGVLDMGENVAEWVSVEVERGAEMGIPAHGGRTLSEREMDPTEFMYSPDYLGAPLGFRCANDAE